MQVQFGKVIVMSPAYMEGFRAAFLQNPQAARIVFRQEANEPASFDDEFSLSDMLAHTNLKRVGGEYINLDDENDPLNGHFVAVTNTIRSNIGTFNEMFRYVLPDQFLVNAPPIVLPQVTGKGLTDFLSYVRQEAGHDKDQIVVELDEFASSPESKRLVSGKLNTFA